MKRQPNKSRSSTTGRQAVDNVVYVKKAMVSLLCLGILLVAGVPRKMLFSEVTNTLPLYASFAFFALFGAMWVYTIFFLNSPSGQLYETNTQFVQFATITAVLGSLSWVVGMWPEFGVLTIPLYAVSLTLVSHLVGLIPRRKALKRL